MRGHTPRLVVRTAQNALLAQNIRSRSERPPLPDFATA